MLQVIKVNILYIFTHGTLGWTKTFVFFWIPHSNSTGRQLTKCEGSRKKRPLGQQESAEMLLLTFRHSLTHLSLFRKQRKKSSKSSRRTLWKGCSDGWWCLSRSSTSFPLWLPLICFSGLIFPLLVACASPGRSSCIPEADKLHKHGWHQCPTWCNLVFPDDRKQKKERKTVETPDDCESLSERVLSALVMFSGHCCMSDYRPCLISTRLHNFS